MGELPKSLQSLAGMVFLEMLKQWLADRDATLARLVAGDRSQTDLVKLVAYQLVQQTVAMLKPVLALPAMTMEQFIASLAPSAQQIEGKPCLLSFQLIQHDVRSLHY